MSWEEEGEHLAGVEEESVLVEAGIALNVLPDWQQKGRRRRRRFNFVGDPGVKVAPDDTTSPLSVFETFFRDELVQYIVHATNNYSEIIIPSPHVQEPLENTKVCLNCRNLYLSWNVGIHSCYFFNGYHQKTSIFIVLEQKSFVQHTNIFTSDAPWQLWTDKEDSEAEEQDDALRKLRFTINYLVERFKENYIPEENIPIDEYLSL